MRNLTPIRRRHTQHVDDRLWWNLPGDTNTVAAEPDETFSERSSVVHYTCPSTQVTEHDVHCAFLCKERGKAQQTALRRPSFAENWHRCALLRTTISQWWRKATARHYLSACKNIAWKERCLSYVPFLAFARAYQWGFLIHDFAAGLSVGIASIPMGMSYALLAGLHPVHGLYNNFIYPLFYMLLGTQRQVCVGTSAIEAMMSAAAVAKIVPANASEDDWLNASAGLALGVGIAMLLMRLLGLSMISNFLADPILSGFSTGSAIIIGTSQLKHVLGVKPTKSVTTVPHMWWFLLTHLKSIHVASVLVAGFGVAVMLFTQYANRRWLAKYPFPAAFFVMALCIPVSFFLTAYGGIQLDIVAHIPQGFPSFRPFNWNVPTVHVTQLLKQSVCYAFFYFIIHVTIAKTIAQQHSISLNAAQEVLACGIASVFGSFFQCFPIATSLSRTSLANNANARTPFYNVANAGVVALTLASATPLLYYLPKAALGSVVLVGVYGMFFLSDAICLFQTSTADFCLWIVSCLVAIFWGAMEGVAVSVALSILWLLKKNAYPAIVELGRLPNTTIYRDIRRFPMASTFQGCKILRFDASLNFANADQFERSLLNACDARSRCIAACLNSEPIVSSECQAASVHTIIIDASSINDMDVTAVRMLKSVAKELKERDVLLLFANWKGPMRDFLERTAFYAAVPPHYCFLSLHDAVLWADNARQKRLAAGKKNELQRRWTDASSDIADFPVKKNSVLENISVAMTQQETHISSQTTSQGTQISSQDNLQETQILSQGSSQETLPLPNNQDATTSDESKDIISVSEQTIMP